MLNQLPGFAGKLMEDYFCKLPKIDEGLAVGGALDVIAWAIGGRCRVQPPSVTARWKDSDIPQPLAWNPLVLVGPGGKEVVEATESLLGLVDNKPPPAGPVWPQAAPLPPRERSRLSTWQGPFLNPLFNRDYHLLVPANGHMASGTSPDLAPLVGRLRAIAASKVKLVRTDADAAEAYRGLLHQWLKHAAEDCDFNPLTGRVRRWMNLAAHLAVGVDHEWPVITYPVLAVAWEVAVLNHDATWSLLDNAGGLVPVH